MSPKREFLEAVRLYLMTNQTTTLTQLGKVVNKITYGLSRNTSIKALLSTDPRFVVSGNSVKMASQPRPPSSGTRRPLAEILSDTADAFFLHVKLKFDSGGYLPSNKVNWSQLENEFLTWAQQTGMRGGYWKVCDVLVSKNLVILKSGTNRSSGRRYYYRRFVFELAGPRPGEFPSRERAEVLSAAGVEVSPLCIDFGVVAPSTAPRCTITVINNTTASRTLSQVSFVGGGGWNRPPFSINFGTTRLPVQLVRDMPYTFQVVFAPQTVGNSKCVLKFDITSSEGGVTRSYNLVRFISAHSGDANLRAALNPSTPFVRNRVARPDESAVSIVKAEKDKGIVGGKFVVALAQVKMPPEFRQQSRLGEMTRMLAALHAEVRDETLPIADRVKKYRELQRQLLFLEEMQCELDIRQFDLKSSRLTPIREGFMSLTVAGLAEKRPSVLRGDAVLALVIVNGDKKKWEGVVQRVQLLDLHLRFHKHFPRVLAINSDIEFTFKRTALNLQHQGVAKVSNDALLLPQSTLQPPLFARAYTAALAGSRLNTAQMGAVRGILAGTCRPAPFVVYGPPGTGKTTTLVEAIKNVLRYRTGGSVLVCAPSNKAADVLLKRLAPFLPPSEMFRFMSFNREKKEVPDVVLPYCNFDGENFNVPELDLLRSYRVVVSTLIMASKLYNLGINESSEVMHFQSIFIDECGHCTEPEVMAVLGVLTNQKNAHQQVVLAGDPEQLGPIVRSAEACKFGLNLSLLERVLKSCPLYRRNINLFPNTLGFDPARVVKLVDCYRCHAEILRVPNELLYDNDLVACGDHTLVSSMARWSGIEDHPRFPLIFHGCEGENVREGNSPSWFNVSEVEVVIRYVLRLKEAIKSCELPDLALKEVGIITPYQKQVAKIREALRMNKITDVDVGSVEQFQGDERRVIILSTVRSDPQFIELDERHNMGFVSSPKRFNVSVTRAQALLVVVGSPKVLATDPSWSRLLWHCVDNNAYVGSLPLPPRPEVFPPPPPSEGQDDDQEAGDDDDDDDSAWVDVPGADELQREIAALSDGLASLSVLEANGGAWDRDE